ncbi:zinc finger protein 569-like isoform X2 [Armigeres subalbatus]|uniref:zinc finger protein 569-like isoform X2 n=1 Tax=Armigeres subalbatus TaxID=124917 RepID=UPI002ED08680
MEVMDMSCDYDLSTICRSCRKEHRNMQPIFDNLQGNGLSLQEMMSLCTQLQIHFNDGMPQQLCPPCVTDVNTAYNFRKQSEQTDRLLRDYLSRRDLGTSGVDGVIKVELFEIKPEITLADADPLIGEKCFAVALGDGIQAIDDNDGGLIEALDDDVDDTIQVDYGGNSDHDSTIEYEVEQLDELIEEEAVLEEEKPRKNQTRGRKGHGYTRIEGGKFACDSCDKVFTDRRGITNHVKQHEPKEAKLKECPTCGQIFTSAYHLSRHAKIHEEDVQCEQCEKKFPIDNYEEYKQHMEQEHPGVQLIPQKKYEKTERELTDLGLSLTAEMVAERGKMEAICRICDTTFDRISELRSHLRTHADPKTFADVNIHTKPYLFEDGYVQENYLDYLVQQVCKWDVFRFHQIVDPDGEELELSDSDSEIENEEQPIEGIVRREHICGLCSQSFPRRKQIMDHARDHHKPEELFACRQCSRGFPSTELVLRHMKQQCQNQQKKFLCTFCNEKFMWQTSLNKHAKVKHKPARPLWIKAEPTGEEEKKYVCQVCCKGFQRLEHLERHIKIHIPSEKKFECSQCHKKFNRKDNLRSHMKIHKKKVEEDVAEKQNQLCVYCGRAFSNSSNLIVHLRRHTGERPYKCDICDKGFPRSSDLQCHRRTHTGEKPCLCTICGKGFSRSNKLVRHMRIHTGTRPYACTYCDRSFTQSNDLTLHIRRHTGEKPYVCGVCNERFIQGTALKAHQRITGHFDDGSTQPERFASISVNNPNRVENNGPKAGRSSSGCNVEVIPKVVKPVKSRRKAKTTASSSTSVSTQPMVSEPPATVVTSPPTLTISSAPTSPGESSPNGSRAPTHHPSLGLNNLSGAPHGYVPVPYMMQNYDLASSGLFSQNFSQP